jgi:hypothetical protein
MGNAVSFTYGEFSVHDDVQVNVETETHFPHEEFVESRNAFRSQISGRAREAVDVLPRTAELN